jgi:hypothetical protein
MKTALQRCVPNKLTFLKYSKLDLNFLRSLFKIIDLQTSIIKHLGSDILPFKKFV